ncbi:MAG: metallophosphoesterase family protein [Elusimicrobia bacterium]|nr:metallophosphoesterase family protein [Elusimicrobiota bacterium]
MKFGIIADIHANYPSLEAVLAILKKNEVEGYLVLGDIIGYGPHPNECLEAVIKMNNALVIVGNHDWACVDLEDVSSFNTMARQSVDWTKTVLKKENRDYIQSLDYILGSGAFMAVHGSPRDPLDEYLDSLEIFEENIPFFKERNLCFVGHHHFPLYFRKLAADGILVGNRLKENEELKINSAEITVVNPGSVGQPRDGDARASCGIFDDHELVFKILRVAYDINLVQQDMRQKQLPDALIQRLTVGR